MNSSSWSSQEIYLHVADTTWKVFNLRISKYWKITSFWFYLLSHMMWTTLPAMCSLTFLICNLMHCQRDILDLHYCWDFAQSSRDEEAYSVNPFWLNCRWVIFLKEHERCFSTESHAMVWIVISYSKFSYIIISQCRNTQWSYITLQQWCKLLRVQKADRLSSSMKNNSTLH